MATPLTPTPRPPMPADFLVNRADLAEGRVAESEQPALAAGEALLKVERFGFTANNVTYAVMGEAMSYWDFFPAPDGWGRVPVWGFAEVVASEAAGVEAGSRVYGYLPPSSHLPVTPASVEPGGFVDGSAHRAALPPAYQRYLRTDADPLYSAATEEIQMLLRPLFITSFLIDDQLDDEGLATQGPVLFSSASSKTAIAAAYLLSRREGIELVGLTSPGNAEFVAGLGIYGSTLTYSEIDTLPRGTATYVDLAGDGAVRQAVHSHFGDDLARSIAVGLTHHEQFGTRTGELPGPRPTLFFAPDRVEKRSADWGRAGLEQRVAEAWHPFCEWSAGWLETISSDGLQGLAEAYPEILAGKVEPRRAHAVTLEPGAADVNQ